MKCKIDKVKYNGKKYEIRLEPNGDVWFKKDNGYFAHANAEGKPVRSINKAKSVVLKILETKK